MSNSFSIFYLIKAPLLSKRGPCHWAVAELSSLTKFSLTKKSMLAEGHTGSVRVPNL